MIKPGDIVEFKLYKHPEENELKGIVQHVPTEEYPYWIIGTARAEYNFKEYCWVRKIVRRSRFLRRFDD